MIPLTRELILKWLELEEDEVNIEQFRRKHEIVAGGSTLKVTFSRLVDEGVLKRLRRGWYRRISPIEPIEWWEGEEKPRLPLVWPYGVNDKSTFGFDNNIEIFAGDVIVLVGDSNWGKTTLGLNFLVNNLHLFEGARLMVNEYKPIRFRSRMRGFTWVDFWDGDKPKFELLPVTENHVDYIKPDYLNVIDWLHISKEFWDVSTITEAIGMQLRLGIALVILQKTEGKKMGVGGDWGKFFPSVYLALDPPGKLTVIKVKSAPLGAMSPEGKSYAYDIIDRGSKFDHIREVQTCPACKGRRYLFDKECPRCLKKGFVEL